MATQPHPSELPTEQAWAKAKAHCFDLLATRGRSVDELRQALQGKGHDTELCERLLRKLADSGLVDDVEFARKWVWARHSNQGLGTRAIRVELQRKGVADETITAAVAEVTADDEEQRARELVRKRLRSMSGLSEQTITRRLLGALGRKGYSQGVAYHVVREELADVGSGSSPLDDEFPD